GITEICEVLTDFIVADSTSAPLPAKVVTSDGPYAPTETAPAELGLASDTVTYAISICNDQTANFTLPDPVLADLLPEELTYVPNSLALIENTTGIAFTDTGSNPAFTAIDDFANSGRQLLRWNFVGGY
ncbi:MAG: hypothetical protein AB8G22_06025, partial [Saprospiraceae bacterium]